MVIDAERAVESQHSPARTKLLIPELPHSYVPRARLVRRLNDSVADFAITLVAGFAGSGKTVLLAEFARSQPPGTVAWLSCDVTDADPVHFWTALVGALRAFDPTIGTDALDLLDVDGQLGSDAIASLVNDLFDLDGIRLVVIDDLHLVARAALASLGEFLERLPGPVRVVMSARSDPRVPLHRWRAGGRLNELRAAELRMSASEVTQFLGAVGIAVSTEDSAVLAERTEGWAAGVQLAALSMRHEPEPAAFIHTFAGTDRNVADFLIGEILERQSDDVVSFLLSTSVLDELSAPLCDQLMARSDSAAMLQRLERDQLFVLPLDNEQTLYRYHHLFAELLRRLLGAREPARSLELHHLASDWYAQHDDARRAVRHAILAEDPARVTALLRGQMLTEFFTGAGEMVREWINDLSRARIDTPAELMLEYALALTMIGALDDARAWLARVDATLPNDASSTTRARVAIAHALTLGLRGDVAPAMAACEQARALVRPGTDAFIDATLQNVMMRAYMYMDNLVAARALYDASRHQHGDPQDLEHVVLEGIFSQAQLEAGALESARHHAASAAASVVRLGAERHFGSNDILRTLAALAYEDNRLDEAEQLLELCIDLLQTGRPVFLLVTHLELARVWNARGDHETAFAELDRARAAVAEDLRSPVTDRVDAYRARLLIESGDVPSARELATHLPAGRRRSIIEARCNLAQHHLDETRATLDKVASSSSNSREALECALLEARCIVEQNGDDLTTKAARVLQLGRAAGFLRSLADEGPEVAAALAHVLHHQAADAYSDRLVPILEQAIAAAPAHKVVLTGGVVLSERELTVLKYLATRLTTREIAAELYVSMNTLRTHTKSIYRKLGVESRAEAAAAARTAGIL
jgi:LuxR family transcriptional regulator, maltose regulon positive regulatory protein